MSLLAETVTHDLTLRVYTPQQILLDGTTENDEPVFELQSCLGATAGSMMAGTVLISMTQIPCLVRSLSKSYSAARIVKPLWHVEGDTLRDDDTIPERHPHHAFRAPPLRKPSLSTYVRGLIHGLLLGIVLAIAVWIILF